MVEVTAVRTTGIYCRAGCPARPHEHNTEPFRSQILAEVAGYRPCLRCRPDLERVDVVVDGAPHAIHLAVEMIAHGFLDANAEADLAAAVGYSSRHLRRLFDQYVGATPDAVARSRRAHFARRLLDDTDLTVEDIARAAGFTSARNMARSVTEVFGFSPSRLRRGVRGSKSALDGGLKIDLRVASDAWEAFLEHAAPRCVPGVESVVGGRYSRTFEHLGHPGVVEFTSEPQRLGAVTAVFHLPSYSGLIGLAEKARRLVGVDVDLTAAAAALATDPLVGQLAPTSARSIPGCWDKWETLVRIVVGQQVSVRGASTLMGRIVSAVGTPIGGLSDVGLSRLFPSAEVLAGSDLIGLGLTDARARTLVELASAVASGEVDLDSDSISLRSQLVALRGIGPWTAELAALRVARDLDAFPSSDLVLRQALGDRTGEGTVSGDRAAELAQRWRPHRGFAATLLWRSRVGTR